MSIQTAMARGRSTKSILSGFESGDFSIKPKFESIITPKLFTQLFEFEFRAQNFLEQISGFESGDFSIRTKFRSIITPKLITQLFEFEFRAQNFLEQIKCFHVGRVSR